MPRTFNHKAKQNFQDEVRVLGSKLFIDGTAVTASAADLNEIGGGAAFASVVAALGTNQGTAAVLTAKNNVITGADGTKGVKLPTATVGDVFEVVNSDASNILKVYPATGAAINSITANGSFSVGPGRTTQFVATSATQLYTEGVAAGTPTVTQLNLLVQGVAAGYKEARGEHTQLAASDTVVTGLATVVSVVVSPRTVTVKQLFFQGSPGDQAGTPAAGSVLITSKKPTAVNDVTPTAATDFTDNIVVDWVAIGT